MNEKFATVSVAGARWQLVVTRNMSLWHQHSSVYGSYHHQQDFGVDTPFDYMSLTVNGLHSTAFVMPESLEQYTAAVLRTIESEEKLTTLREKYFLYGKELEAALQTCLNDFTPPNWETFVDAYRRYAAGLIITNIIGRPVSAVLVEKLLGAGITQSEVQLVMNTITYPQDHTPLFQSHLDMLRIGGDVQAGTVTQRSANGRLHEWLASYQHIPVNFNDEPWSMSDAQAELSNALRKDCQREIDDLQINHESKVKEAEQRLDQLNRPDITLLAHAIQSGTYLNEYRKNIFSKVSLAYRPLFKEIARLTKFEQWQNCYYLFPEEMTAILRGDKINADQLIAQRDVIAIKMRDDEVVTLSSTDAHHLKQFVDRHEGRSRRTETTAGEIKGVVANRGHARGVVKIVLSSQDFHKVEDSDILVTTMTSVDFIPIMKKAAAFVTNEGGITSHASIVSREMNKPCIIGTKNATQSLHDGDLVEVDAEQGIVRIIS